MRSRQLRNIRNVVLIDGVRTPFVRSFRKFNHVEQYDLLTKTFVELFKRNPNFDPQQIDLVLGGVTGERTIHWIKHFFVK